MPRVSGQADSSLLDAVASASDPDSGPSTAVLVALWSAFGLAIAGLLAEDPAAVHEVLEPVTRVLDGNGPPESVTVMLWASEIEALVALGRVDEAARRTAVLETSDLRPQCLPLDVAALRSRALVDAARGDLVDAERAATQAAERCRGLSSRLEIGRTYLVAGRIARRCRHKAQAHALLEQAALVFAEIGSGRLLERTIAEAARLGAAPDGVLTATESQVAALSASGRTNRSVAALLGISPKTVEANLSRIYRKLGIRSRAELGACLARRADGIEAAVIP